MSSRKWFPKEVGKDGSREVKPVCKFKGKTKKFVLNKTNSRLLENLYGSRLEDWADKKITLVPGTTDFPKPGTACIRMQAPRDYVPSEEVLRNRMMTWTMRFHFDKRDDTKNTTHRSEIANLVERDSTGHDGLHRRYLASREERNLPGPAPVLPGSWFARAKEIREAF